jgi:hypothetical protein
MKEPSQNSTPDSGDRQQQLNRGSTHTGIGHMLTTAPGLVYPYYYYYYYHHHHHHYHYHHPCHHLLAGYLQFTILITGSQKHLS